MVNKVLIGFLRLLSTMPLGLARCLGSLIGRFCWLIKTREAKTTLTNLRHCYPRLEKTELKRLAKQSMKHWGISLLEIPVVWSHSTQWLDKKILKIENQELYEDYRKGSQGLIILAPHFGNWEVVGLFCSRNSAITSMFSPSENKALDQWVKESRERVGAKLVTADNRGVIALIKALKNQKDIGILPDQVPNLEGGDYADFFNSPALTMTLVHKLIDRTGAAALFCYARRVKGGFHLVFEQAPSGIDGDQQQSLSALNKGVENCINAAVEQYQWEYKRFKRQADGSNIYAKKNDM